MFSPNYIKSRYDKKYYATFAGFGRRLKELAKYLPGSRVKPGMTALDVGCGTGDWVDYLTKLGYQATGVDYSPDAIALARQQQGKFRVMDATQLDFPKNSFDAVFSIEVAEHVTQKDLILSLKEIRRVLKPGGFLFLHTEPNKTFNDYFYRYWSYPVGNLLIKVNNLMGNHFPLMVKHSEMRSEINKITHINEPSYYSLKKALKQAGFGGCLISTNIVWNKPLISWKDRLFNIVVYADPLARIWPFNILMGQDFLVKAYKK